MKTVLALTITAALMVSIAANAAKNSAAKAPKAKAVAANKLSRNLSFSGSSVDGKYHSAGESVAQVESEKSLNMLMGIRKNFRDRLGEEKARLAAGEGTKQ